MEAQSKSHPSTTILAVGIVYVVISVGAALSPDGEYRLLSSLSAHPIIRQHVMRIRNALYILKTICRFMFCI